MADILGVALFIVSLWLLIGTAGHFVSGWHRLAARFPRSSEPTLRELPEVSGEMGLFMRYGYSLGLRAHPSGLEVTTWRLLSPLSRPFCVPWTELSVDRFRGILRWRVRLGFGRPEHGSLTIGASDWDSLINDLPQAAVAFRSRNPVEALH